MVGVVVDLMIDSREGLLQVLVQIHPVNPDLGEVARGSCVLVPNRADDNVGALVEDFADFLDPLHVLLLPGIAQDGIVGIEEGEGLIVDPHPETEIEVHREVVAIDDADEFGPKDIVRLGRVFGAEGEGKEEEAEE